jgi:hypothetical protein
LHPAEYGLEEDNLQSPKSLIIVVLCVSLVCGRKCEEEREKESRGKEEGMIGQGRNLHTGVQRFTTEVATQCEFTRMVSLLSKCSKELTMTRKQFIPFVIKTPEIHLQFKLTTGRKIKILLSFASVIALASPNEKLI